MEWIHCPSCGGDLFRISSTGEIFCSQCGRRLDVPPKKPPSPPGPSPPPVSPGPGHPDVKGPTWISGRHGDVPQG